MKLKKPTETQKALLESIIVLEAYIETIKPVITAIYNDVLFYMLPEHIAVDKRTGEKITDYNQLYRVEDSEYIPAFYKEANRVLIEKGFKPEKEGCCHLLESECLKRDFEHKFVKACIAELPEEILQGKTPVEFYTSLLNRLEFFKRFLGICKNYVIGFVDTEKLKARYLPANPC